jgi:hypothetical protein
MAIVCNHCAAMEQVLTDLVGSKVSRVIMKRVENELHAQSKTPIQVQALTSVLSHESNQPT